MQQGLRQLGDHRIGIVVADGQQRFCLPEQFDRHRGRPGSSFPCRLPQPPDGSQAASVRSTYVVAGEL